MDRFKHNLH